jgi:hypothetical protein
VHASAPRIALGLALTAGLLSFGFAVTGTPIGALSPPIGPGGIPVLPGSDATHSLVLVDGEETRVSDCTVATSPAVVLERYERIAREENASRDTPYLVQESPGGSAALAWVAPDGRRRAVLIHPDAQGGTTYRLLEAAAPSAGATRRLPCGLDRPEGTDVLLAVERPGGGGLCLLASPMSPGVTAERCLAALARLGVAPDPAAQALLAGADGPSTLLLRDQEGSRGTLVIAPDGRGGARVSLTLQP